MPRRAVRRLKRRLGRRGATLTPLGIVWILYGYSMIAQPLAAQRGLPLLLQRVSLDVWGWAWIVSGVVALVYAWAPPGRDAAGFVSLVLIVVPWTTGYLASWLLGDYPRGWVAAAVWTGLSVPILVALGWPEPARQKRVGPPYEHES